jgi:hypothetical protein
VSGEQPLLVNVTLLCNDAPKEREDPMRALMISAALAAAVPGIAAAQAYGSSYQPYRPYQPYQAQTYQAPRTTYDYNTGSTYTTTPMYGGGAQVNGYNSRTGSTWNSTYQSNGQMSGTNSKGQYWTGNSQTGYYHNYTTGRTCYGTGYARTCY